MIEQVAVVVADKKKARQKAIPTSYQRYGGYVCCLDNPKQTTDYLLFYSDFFSSPLLANETTSISGGGDGSE